VDESTEAQVEAMNAKLQARSAPSSIKRSEAGQSPKEKSEVKLEWERIALDAKKTKCGCYSCCKVTVNGKTTYELWKHVPGEKMFTLIGPGLESFDKACDLAQQDANS
jgi:hypothetical protein